MFELFLFLCVVAFVVWCVKKNNLRAGNSLPAVTLDNSDNSPKQSDWGSNTYTPSAPTRTTYKPSSSSSSSRSRSSSSSSSFGSRPGGGFGGGRSGGGGSSSSW